MALYDAIIPIILADSPLTAEEFIKKLIPNFWDFIIQLAAFIVLVIAVFFIAYKPVKKFIDQRKKYVEGNIKDSEKVKEEGLKFKKIHEEGVANAKKEGQKIVNEAKLDAQKEADRITSEARDKANEIVEKAKLEANEAKERSKAEAKEEMVKVAFLASEKLLSREVNQKDEEKLLQDFVDEVYPDSNKPTSKEEK